MNISDLTLGALSAAPFIILLGIGAVVNDIAVKAESRQAKREREKLRHKERQQAYKDMVEMAVLAYIYGGVQKND